MFNSIGRCQVHLTAAENMVIGFYWRITPETEPSAITGCGIMALHEKKSSLLLCGIFVFCSKFFYRPQRVRERKTGVAPEWKTQKNAEWCWAPWSAWARVSESASIFDTLPHQAPHSFVSPHTHTTPHLQHTPKSIFMHHTNSREKTLKRL